MLDRAKLTALRLLPKNTVSRAVGALSELPLPGAVQGVVNESFATLASIDVSESESPPADYPSLNAFFTRRLVAGARTPEFADGHDLVSPADGRLSHFGKITRETLVQAKGREYRLIDLVDSGREAEAFVDGAFATIYLSPRDYHRVHSPCSGEVKRISYIPGHLFPVNPFAVAHIDELFAVNERLITYVQSDELDQVGVVMVGATCVGRMSLDFHPLVTNQKFRRREDVVPDDTIHLGHADELGMFNLGSTVVLLIAEPAFEFDESLIPGQPVRVGQHLGRSPA